MYTGTYNNILYTNFYSGARNFHTFCKSNVGARNFRKFHKSLDIANISSHKPVIAEWLYKTTKCLTQQFVATNQFISSVQNRVVANKSWFTVVITYQLLLLKTLIQYLSTAISLAIFSLLEPTNK